MVKFGERHHALLVQGPPVLEELLTCRLWELGTVGIEELSPGCCKGYFTAMFGEAELNQLRALGATLLAWEPVTERDWVASSRRQMRATRVGPILIRPPWSRAKARPGDILLEIEPARAFGTGAHESTRLMLRELVSLRRQTDVVLDVGCGTGILALAALKLGAREVVAVDIDDEACRATLENAHSNGMSDARLLVAQAGADAVTGSYDLVIANLTLDILRRVAVDLWSRIPPLGVLVTSGVLAVDEEELVELFVRLGATRLKTRTAGQWVAVRFARQLVR